MPCTPREIGAGIPAHFAGATAAVPETGIDSITCARASRSCRASRWSVRDGEALADVLRLLHLVEERDRVVLGRDAALAPGVGQELIATEPELSGTLAGSDHRGRADVAPVERLVLPEDLER